MMRSCALLALALTGASLLASPDPARMAAAAPAGDVVSTPAPVPPTGAAPEKQKKERKLTIQSPDGTLTYDDATRTYIVTNATIELPDSNAVLTASRVEYNQDERWIQATGKPRMWDETTEITADTIRADLRAKRANADGNVRMVARPKPAKTEQGRKARKRIKEPVIVTCDAIQYFYKDKKGTATGSLRITQKDNRGDRTATGARLAYDGNDDTVILEGDVHVSNIKGEGFQCTRVVFNIKEGAEGFQVEGLRSGIFYIQEEEEDEQKPRPASVAPPTPEKPPAPPGEAGTPAPPGAENSRR